MARATPLEAGSAAGGYYTRRTSAKKKSGGTSILGALKDLGSNTLKALTVPGAVVVTGLNAATGGKVSLRDLGGAFTSGPEGHGAGWRLLKRFGASEGVARWGGLAPEILLDPTTYLSFGATAGAKVAGGAARAQKLAQLAQLERQVVKLRQADDLVVKTADGVAAGLNPKRVQQLERVARKANTVRRELETMGKVPVARIGVGRKKITVNVDKPGHALHAGRAGTEAVEVTVPRGLEVRLPTFGVKSKRGVSRSEARFAKDPLKGNRFKLSPVARETRRNARVVADLAHVSEAIQKAAVAHYKITPEELQYVKHYLEFGASGAHGKALAAGATGPKAAAEFKADLVAAGKWRPEFDVLAETYRKIDTELLKVNDLVPYEDQLRLFTQHVAEGVEDVNRLAARRATEEGFAHSKAAGSRATLNQDAVAKAKADVAAKTPLLDEVDAEIERVRLAWTSGTSLDADKASVNARLKALRARKLGLSTQIRAAQKIVDSGLAPVKRGAKIERELERTLKKIDKRYAGKPAEAWAARTAAFTDAARKGGYAHVWGVGKAGKPKRSIIDPKMEEIALRLSSVEGHVTAGVDPEVFAALRAYRAKDLQEGISVPRLATIFDSGGKIRVKVPRATQSPINVESERQFLHRLVNDGVPKEWAERMAGIWKKYGHAFADKDQFWEKTTIQRLPDVDFFRSQRLGAQQTSMDALKAHTEQLLAGFGKGPKEVENMIADIAGRWDQVAASMPYGLRSVLTAKRGAAAGESRFAITTAWLKMWYTSFNPIGHYTLNATGNFLNSLIQGNKYHFSRGLLGAFGFATRGLAKMDPKAMEKMYKVGDRQVSGLEMLVTAAVSGLGAPYAKGEIADVIRLVESTKEGKHRWLARHLNDFQMNRESADRLYSFLNHIRGGDDMFTAGSKVVRYAFDYDELTHFEKIWMRNLLIFYTWFRKNLTFQGYGVLARPGAYAAMAKIEAARVKDPDEPEWWKKAGGIGTPIGLLTFGNPYADIFKYTVDAEDNRKTILGSVTPFVKLPVEILANRNMFSGLPVDRRGESPTVSRLKHVGRSLQGPQGKFVESALKDTPPRVKSVDLLGRFAGIKIQRPPDPKTKRKKPTQDPGTRP